MPGRHAVVTARKNTPETGSADETGEMKCGSQVQECFRIQVAICQEPFRKRSAEKCAKHGPPAISVCPAASCRQITARQSPPEKIVRTGRHGTPKCPALLLNAKQAQFLKELSL